ncbi:MAG: SxtJ family membrane protein [Myxococcota bacterium]
MIEIDLSPPERTLRQFGFVALGGFGLAAVLAWTESLVFAIGLGDWRPRIAALLAALGLLSALFSLVWPRANRPLYVGLLVVGYPIGFVLSYAILGLLFYLLFTPIGLGLRLLGHDPLQRRFEPDAESYWSEARRERSAESYFKQF